MVKQEAQLSQRDRATLPVIVNFSSLGAFKRSLQLVNFGEFLRYSLID